jgi:hypothetical protein
VTAPAHNHDPSGDVRLSTLLSLVTDFLSRVGIPVALAIFLLWQQQTTLAALTNRCDLNSTTLSQLRSDFDRIQGRLDAGK